MLIGVLVVRVLCMAPWLGLLLAFRLRYPGRFPTAVVWRAARAAGGIQIWLWLPTHEPGQGIAPVAALEPSVGLILLPASAKLYL